MSQMITVEFKPKDPQLESIFLNGTDEKIFVVVQEGMPGETQFVLKIQEKEEEKNIYNFWQENKSFLIPGGYDVKLYQNGEVVKSINKIAGARFQHRLLGGLIGPLPKELILLYNEEE